MSTFFFPKLKDIIDDEAKKIAYSCALFVLRDSRDEVNVTKDDYNVKNQKYSEVCKVKSHVDESDEVFQPRRFSNWLKRHEIPSDSILV